MAIKISDLLPAASFVEVNGQKVQINPLTLEQVIRLLTVYRYDLVVMFSDSVAGDLNLITLVATAPNMVADILAYGMDADGQQSDILKLPAHNQVELLAAIWKVSVPDPKKLMSLLLGAMEGLQQAGISPALPSEESTQKSTESLTTESAVPTETTPPSIQSEPLSTTS